MANKHLLIIAFHFPPLQGSSGLHRTLSLIRYLPQNDWRITVLTVSPSTYQKIHRENYDLIPDRVSVIRAPALDTIRDLSIKGRYPGFLAFPDKYQSWIASGVIRGLMRCRSDRPSAIYSTFPIASAHYIGWVINKVTKIPWVVDFRDPMAQSDYPKDLRKKRQLHRLERRFVGAADAVLVTTPGTKRIYEGRYRELNENLWHVVPNGYDEMMFDGISASDSDSCPQEITLLHSGALYRSERDPACLFRALADLKAEGSQNMDRLKVLFRGSRHVEYFMNMAEDLGVTSHVIFGDAIPYKKAVSEMLGADALLILQASNCNEQIPAKVYEYLRANRPILALTDSTGDTAKLLASCGITNVAALDDSKAIKTLLKGFLQGDRSGIMASSDCDIGKFSRHGIALDVSKILTRVST